MMTIRGLVHWAAIAAVGVSASGHGGHNYEVTVGKGSELKFVPETVVANIGDTVTYKFFAKVCFPVLCCANPVQNLKAKEG